MGLKDYRKYQRKQEIREFLASYGVSESDLAYLHEALSIVKALKSRADEQPIGEKPSPSEEQRKIFKEQREKSLKPEDIVGMFADDAEEFYPNGRRKQS